MSLQTRLASFIAAVGTDIKSLQTQINNLSASSDPWTYVVSGSDVPNATITGVDVVATGTGLATGKYVLEGKMWWTTSLTTTGVQFGLVYPSQVAAAVMWQDAISQTANQVWHATASASFTNNNSSPGQSPNAYLATIDGIFTVSAALSSSISAQVRSEVASSSVTAKAGSFIRYRKIAS